MSSVVKQFCGWCGEETDDGRPCQSCANIEVKFKRIQEARPMKPALKFNHRAKWRGIQASLPPSDF